jgi:hypothetical protein
MLACQRQILEAVRNGRQATGRVWAIHLGLALHMTAASPMSEEGRCCRKISFYGRFGFKFAAAVGRSLMH